MSNIETETTKGKKPPYVMLHPREVKGKTYYTRIGVLWPHKDRKGFNQEQYLFPADGKVIIREYSEAE